MSLKDALVSRIAEERGQDLVEYAVLVGFIGVALAVLFIATPLSSEHEALQRRD